MTRGKVGFCVTEERKDVALTAQTGFVMMKKRAKEFGNNRVPVAKLFFFFERSDET